MSIVTALALLVLGFCAGVVFCAEVFKWNLKKRGLWEAAKADLPKPPAN